MSRCRLCRSCTGVGRSLTVCYLLRLQCLTVTVNPSNGVFVHRAAELSRIGGITRYRCNRRRPRIIERVRVLSSSGLSRSLTCVRRSLTIFYLFRLQSLTVTVNPCDLISTGRTREDSLDIINITYYCSRQVQPFAERVGILRSLFRRISGNRCAIYCEGIRTR